MPTVAILGAATASPTLGWPGWTLLAALWLAVLLALVRRFRSLAGTTLGPACLWSAASLTVVLMAEAIIAAGNLQEGADHLRYAAAVSTCCPLMAVLGAKRPQDRAWQFIVLSLLLVLVAPGIGAWLDRPAAPLRLHLAWRGFLTILIVVGLVNHLPTRYWPAAILTLLGQAVLLGGWLIDSDSTIGDSAHRMFAGFTSLAMAEIVRACLPATRRRVSSQPLERVWLDFRDEFGLVWGLRVAERFNAAASMYSWPLRLRWRGFMLPRKNDVAAPVSVETSRGMHKVLRGLLRRFVSPAWLAQRS